MAVIGKPDGAAALNPMGNINIPAMELPSFRYLLGRERQTIKNVLIYSPYALGDCVCAEPVIRYAAKYFAGCEVSLLTAFPELFYHIPLKNIFNTKDPKPDWDKFYVLKCYYAAEELQSEFVHNFNMAIGDYIATNVVKGHLPVADRNIILRPSPQDDVPEKHEVVIHPGKHWMSKTFPKHWWDAVIQGLLKRGVKPAIIGADRGERSYVDVDGSKCFDYRDKTSVMQMVSILQKAQIVLTNDSAPLHIAASGDAYIGFVSTVRHADFVTHWRRDYPSLRNQWSYKMQDFAKGTMWTNEETSPLRNGAKYDVIDQQTLISWLPDPEEMINWTMEKLRLVSH